MKTLYEYSNFFSVIIPTMWKSKLITDLIHKYNSNKLIKEIIIIDNNPKERFINFKSSKISIINNSKNNFVNPSWNLGYTLAKHKIILSNDDIIIGDLNKILNIFNQNTYDLIGVEINTNNEEMFIEDYNETPINSFVCFMYVKNYHYIPESYKIWAGDNYLVDNNKKIGILKNSTIFTKKSETLNSLIDLKETIAKKDRELYYLNKKGVNLSKQKILFVLVNFGNEQINFLQKVVDEIRQFKKFIPKIILHSNIETNVFGIDETKIFNDLDDYQLLPLTCRKTIWDNKDNFDIFVYGENDHLFKEHHIEKHIEYSDILPKNRITGIIQYEENNEELYYPAYHGHYNWDFNSVEKYGDKIFAHFTNLHQATFILTKEQLHTIGNEFDFCDFFSPSNYSKKCKVNTDIYQFTTYKKLICISEFKENLIHHLPNLYINGEKGRRKNQRSDNNRMKLSLLKLLGYDYEFFDENNEKKISIIIPSYKNTSFIDECINSVINSCQGLDVEILIGIDSCNETLDYIKNKSFDNRIKFLFFEEKVGAYIIRNSLAKIANSDILLFFDSDDIMETNMVTNIIDKIKTSDVVRPMYVDFSNTPNYNIKQDNKFGEGVFAIKKDLFLSMNGFEPWPVTADTDFMIRLNKNNKITTYTNSVSFYRRIHPNSLTQAPETGMNSKLRSKYAHMTYSRKDFSPLSKLVTSDFYEVPITTYQYHNTSETPIVSQSKIDIKKLMNINVNKKEPVNIDYDKINSVLNKVPKFYQTINNTPPPRQNIPQNRNELIELKKDSLIKVNRDLFNKGKKFKG